MESECSVTDKEADITVYSSDTTKPEESDPDVLNPVETEYSGTLVPCSDCNLWFATESSLRNHCNDVHLKLVVAVTSASSFQSEVDDKEERPGDRHPEECHITGHANHGKHLENSASSDIVTKQEGQSTNSSSQEDNRCLVPSSSNQASDITFFTGSCHSYQDTRNGNERNNASKEAEMQQTSAVDQKIETGKQSASYMYLSHRQKTDVDSRRPDHKGPIKCSRCASGRLFASARALQLHQVRHHKQEIEHVCHNCGHHFKDTHVQLSSTRTVYTQTGIDRWMCELCCKDGLMSYDDIEEHKRTQHRFNSKALGPQDRFVCKYCSKSFQFPGHLRKHEMVHSGEKPHRCVHCQKCFRLKSQLESHINLHTKQTLYVCGECDSRFYQASTLGRHLRSKHQVWRYECQFCKKGHITKQDRDEHERTHTGIKPYICEECGVGFARKQTLIHHLRAHKNERLFTCDDCGKAFFRKSTLKEHLRTHTGERPYQCQRCSKRFTQKSHLKAHLRSHLRQELEKPQPVVTMVTSSPKTSKIKDINKAKLNAEQKDKNVELKGRLNSPNICVQVNISTVQEDPLPNSDADSQQTVALTAHHINNTDPVPMQLTESDNSIQQSQDQLKRENIDNTVIVCQPIEKTQDITEPVMLQPLSIVMPTQTGDTL